MNLVSSSLFFSPLSPSGRLALHRARLSRASFAISCSSSRSVSYSPASRDSPRTPFFDLASRAPSLFSLPRFFPALADRTPFLERHFTSSRQKPVLQIGLPFARDCDMSPLHPRLLGASTCRGRFPPPNATFVVPLGVASPDKAGSCHWSVYHARCALSFL